MKGSDIVDLVIVKLEEKSAFLGENGTKSPILSSGDNIDELKPVYSYINAHIDQAANEVLLAAPLNRLLPKNGKEVEQSYGGLIYEDPDTAQVPYTCHWTLHSPSNILFLPPDYLRLYSLRYKNWSRPVHKAITKADHLYTLQHNKFTRGTDQKPVVVYSGARYTCNAHQKILDSGNLFYTPLTSIEIENKKSSSSINSQFFGLFDNVVQEEKDAFIVDNTNNWYHLYKDEKSEIQYEKISPAYLEVFCTTAQLSPEDFLYVPVYSNSTDYNRDIAEAIALNCAKKVLEVYSMADKAALVDKELNTVLSNMNL